MFKKQNAVSVLDVPDFVQLLTDAVYKEEDHCERVQAIWRRAVMLDLQDRSVLEGEVLISRIVRQASI